MATVTYLTREDLEAGLEEISRSPKDAGVLEMIVGRPEVNERQVLTEGELTLTDGLVGDNWKRRGRSPSLDRQLTIMNARVIALVAQDRARWEFAGDQLFIDLDLSAANLPAGTQLTIGPAIVEVTPPPHTGCGKFVERFGSDAKAFVNAPERKDLHLRGINAKVVQAGVIRVGDVVSKTSRRT